MRAAVRSCQRKVVAHGSPIATWTNRLWRIHQKRRRMSGTAACRRQSKCRSYSSNPGASSFQLAQSWSATTRRVGRADLVGFRFECPLDAPPESECYGWNPARWMRGDDAWTVNFRATVYGEPRNVLVAPLLAGDTPVAVYESDLGWIVLDTVSEESWQYELYRVPRDDKPESSDMVAVRRVGDDRSELARVAARANRWTFGSRIRAVGEGANIPDRWALPGQYHHLAAGDLDQDGDDDLVLAGPKLLLMLDREEEPTGACLVEVPFAGTVQDLAVADLDGDAAPELILGTAPGLVVYSLQWGP